MNRYLVFEAIIILVGFLVLYAIYSIFQSPSTIVASSSWVSSNSFTTNIDDLSCVSSSGHIYCIAGSLGGNPNTDSVYFAPIYPNGATGSWTATNPYPIKMRDLSCNVYNNYIYCVGGQDASTADYNTVFYAPIIPQGVGPWVETNHYPIALHNHACRIYGSHIYCIGGNSGGSDTNRVYYAPILASHAIGTWTSTTSYPITVEDQACNVFNGYIYCIGGWPQAPPSVDSVNFVYYAPILQSGGLGSWVATTPYPVNTTDHKTCGVSNGYLYCTGGQMTTSTVYTNATYYAPLSSQGVGAWLQGPNYPYKLRSMSATTYNGYLYYIGGTDWSTEQYTLITNAVYYIKTK